MGVCRRSGQGCKSPVGRADVEEMVGTYWWRNWDEPADEETYDEATEMLRNSEKVPALVYCCLDLNRIGRGEEVRYASIYPAVQNLMLAAHAFGLGTCLTIHGSTPTRGEPEVKKILGIPENIKIACLVYMGHPSHRYGRPRRRPIQDHVRYEKWDLVA